MYKNQLDILNKAAENFLSDAQACKAGKARSELTELALKCLAEARGLADEMRRNSVLLFINCAAFLGKDWKKYPVYLDFCARNGLEILSKKDFDILSNSV